MQNKQIAHNDAKFPLGWHAMLNEFVHDILTVEYLYGEVVASVGIVQSQPHKMLRVFLLSEASREVRGEAMSVLDQIHRRIHKRARQTCCVCGKAVSGDLISNCGEHSEAPHASFAALKPLANPAWSAADFHMLIDGTEEDVIRTMAKSQSQMDAATSFVQIYDAPKVSQDLAQAHAQQASWALEDILQR